MLDASMIFLSEGFANKDIEKRLSVQGMHVCMKYCVLVNTVLANKT